MEATAIGARRRRHPLASREAMAEQLLALRSAILGVPSGFEALLDRPARHVRAALLAVQGRRRRLPSATLEALEEGRVEDHLASLLAPSRGKAALLRLPRAVKA
jgi:hypothetical protein